MPDGTIIQGVPEGTTKEELLTRYNRYKPPAPEKEQGGFFSSFGNAATGLGDAATAAKFVAASGKPEEAAARKALIDANQPDYATTSFSDIKDPMDAFNWARQTAGSSLGALAVPGAASLGAGLMRGPGVAKVAGLGVMGAQYLLENLGRQAQTQQTAVESKQAPEETSLGKAAIGAAGQTALDAVGFKFLRPVIGKFPGVGKLFGTEGAEAAKQTAAQLADAFEKKTLKYSNGVLKTVGLGVAVEVPQEIAQQALERWQAGLSLTDQDAIHEYTEAAAGAVLLGGGLGGMGTFMNNRAKISEAKQYIDARELTKAAEQQEAPADETVEAPETLDEVKKEPAKITKLKARLADSTYYSTPESKIAAEAELAELVAKEAEKKVKKQAEEKPLEEQIADDEKRIVEDKFKNEFAKKGVIARVARLKQELAELVAKEAENAPIVDETTFISGEPNAAKPKTPERVDAGAVAGSDGQFVSQLDSETKAAVTSERTRVEDVRNTTEGLTGGEAAQPSALETQQAIATLTGAGIPVTKAREFVAANGTDPAKLNEAIAAHQAAKATPKPKQITKPELKLFQDEYTAATTPEEKAAIQADYQAHLTDIQRAGPELFASQEGAAGAKPLTPLERTQQRGFIRKLNGLRNKITTDEDLASIDALTAKAQSGAQDIGGDISKLEKTYASEEAQNSYENLFTRLNKIILETNTAKKNSSATVPTPTPALEYLATTLDTARDLLDELKTQGAPSPTDVNKRHGDVRKAIGIKLKDLEDSITARRTRPESSEALNERERLALERAQQKIKEENSKDQEPERGVFSQKLFSLLKSGDVNKVIKHLATSAKGYVTDRKLPTSSDSGETRRIVKAIETALAAHERGETNLAAALESGMGVSPKQAVMLLQHLKNIETIKENGKFDPDAARTALAASVQLEIEAGKQSSTEGIVFKKVAEVLGTINFNTKIQVEGESGTDAKEIENLYNKRAFGRYDPIKDIIYLRKDGTDEATVLHEIVHAGTIKLLRQYEIDPSKLSQDQRDAIEHLNKIMVAAKKKLGGKYKNAFDNIYEFMSYAMTDRTFQIDLAGIQHRNLVKYTAELDVDKEGLIPAQSNLWSQITDALVRLYDLVTAKKTVIKKTDTRLGKIYAGSEGNLALEISEIFGQILEAPTGGININAPLFAQTTKQATPIIKPRSTDTLLDEMRNNREVKFPKQQGKRAFMKTFFTPEGYETAVTHWQNDRAPLKTLENYLRLAGKLIVGGEGFNNLYSLISTSTGKAFGAMTQYVQVPMTDLQKSIDAYAKSKGVSVEEALLRLQLMLTLKHEPERRKVLFLKNVPLNEIGTRLREDINRELAENKNLVNNGRVKKLRQDLEAIVATHKNKNGDSPANKKTVEINDAEYNVLSAYLPEEIEREGKNYDEELKNPAFKAIIDAMKATQEGTKEINKQANFWSNPVNNLVGFYDYQYYVPYKGKPGVSTEGDPQQIYSGKNGRSPDLAEVPNMAQGRKSDPDNPLLQTMVDAAKASIRLGRKDVTQAIKNMVESKLIAGKKATKTIQFSERNTFSWDEYRGPNNVIHYESDGTIEIYRLDEGRISEAIRRSYGDSQPLIQLINNMTSGIGQLHTRYNPSFAPMNFVRDILTNAFAIGAEMGPAEAGKFIGAIASNVVSNGVFKAGKIAHLYQNGNVDEIKRMAKSDPFVQDVLEYLEEGGRVSYIQGLAVKGQMDELTKQVGRSKIIQTKEQLDKWVDIWSDSFELTSRAAAYSIAKSNAKARGLNDKAARIEGATYAKNLANFEQVGKWGKTAGAMFMFFRPAATGAVRALDTIIPAFQSVESVIANMPKHLRNDEAAKANVRKNYAELKKNSQHMMMGLMGAGASIYLMALATSGGDDRDRNLVATDDMARWTRYLRLPTHGLTGKDTEFLQLPWGFGLGAFAAAGAQIAAAATGNSKLSDMAGNLITIGLDSYIPVPVSRMNPLDNISAYIIDSVTPSLARPFVEFAMNKDGLGRDIYNNRQSRIGDAYTGGDNIPEVYKQAAKELVNLSNKFGYPIDVSPNTMYFFANNYLDGVSRIGHNIWNVSATLAGAKDFDPKTDLLVLDSFFGKKSNYDAREYASIENQIKEKEKILKMFESHPQQYVEYLNSHPMDAVIVEEFNKQSAGTLKELRHQANVIRSMDGLSMRERQRMVKDTVLTANFVKRGIIDMFKLYDVKP
jgi:hypothetical protein